jgi:YidC/Oxa1 family membrane protein insertase
MTWLFTTIIYKPLLNILVLLYGVSAQDLGVAIILMTLFIRALSLPLSLRMLRSQREMALLGPEMERIKEAHKGDQSKQGQAMMELYKKHNINPLAGCLPLLIQIPVLLGLYRVFLNIFKPESLDALYAFVPSPGTIETVSLGFVDLASRSIILALMAGAAQFVHAWLARPAQQTGQAAMLSKQMLYFFPIMIIIVSWNLPAGLALYWVVSTLLSIGEQWYVQRSMRHVKPAA